MSKYKVGDLYRVVDPTGQENGNIIQIYEVNGSYIWYKTVTGINPVSDWFGDESSWSKHLVPVNKPAQKIVLVRHDGSSKNYLFTTPVDLHLGDRVICDTSRGEQPATVECDSMVIGEDHNSQVMLAVLVKMASALMPLKSVVGREIRTVERFDVMERKEGKA